MSLPRYAEYCESGVDWIGSVPADWTVASLKRGFAVVGGSTPKSDEAAFWDGDIVWVSPADLSRLPSMYIADSGRKITEAGLNSCGTSMVPAGSIVLSTRAPIGSLAISTSALCTNQGCKSLVPKDIASSNYFAYVLLSATTPLNLRGKGTTFLELSADELAAFKVPYPSVEEQVAIAAFLDRETAKIDALIAEQERLITLLAEKRQATISHAVTKGLNPNAPMKDSGVAWLGEVPAHWEMKRVKDCGCEIVDCKNRTPEPHDDGDYFVVRTSCVKDGQFNPEPGYWTDEANFAEWTAKGQPQAGDVLFTREAPTGEACLAPEGLDFCLGQRMMYIRPPKQVLLSEFLLYSIYGGLARERISEKSKGSTVGHLRVGEVGELPLLQPPLDEQKAIIGFVGKELSKLRALATAAERAISLMTERRSALIAAAVTGQIDVRSA